MTNNYVPKKTKFLFCGNVNLPCVVTKEIERVKTFKAALKMASYM